MCYLLGGSSFVTALQSPLSPGNVLKSMWLPFRVVSEPEAQVLPSVVAPFVLITKALTHGVVECLTDVTTVVNLADVFCGSHACSI